MGVEIKGERLTLRDYLQKDLEQYRRWLQPENEWQKLDGPYYPAETPEKINARVDALARRIAEGKFPEPRTSLAMADKATDALIGSVSSYWISAETSWLAAGLQIYDPASWGKGLGREALGLWVSYLFEARPEIVRLDLRTWSGNRGMMRLAEKLGFKQEACFRKARIVNGEYFDSIGFGILREEWGK